MPWPRLMVAPDRARQIHGEGLGRPARGDGGDRNVDRLRGDARREDQRAGGLRVIGARHGRAVGRGVVHAHLAGAGGIERDRERSLRAGGEARHVGGVPVTDVQVPGGVRASPIGMVSPPWPAGDIGLDVGPGILPSSAPGSGAPDPSARASRFHSRSVDSTTYMLVPCGSKTISRG